jgi:hypothetical protein
VWRVQVPKGDWETVVPECSRLCLGKYTFINSLLNILINCASAICFAVFAMGLADSSLATKQQNNSNQLQNASN